MSAALSFIRHGAQNATPPSAGKKKFVAPSIAVWALFAAALPLVAYPRPQQPLPEPLGSLTTLRDVYVNDSRVESESVVVPGETLRTGDNGMATFRTVNAGSSLVVFPESQVIFAGDPHFLAELSSGTLGINSSGGADGIAVRAGNFAVVPTLIDQATSATMQRKADASFVITCIEGGIGLIPLNGGAGLFFKAGESVRITPAGELMPVQDKAQVAPPAAPPAPVTKKHKRKPRWIL